MNVDMLSFFFYSPPNMSCFFCVRYMGNVLFSCDEYMVTLVQVDLKVMGWKICIWYVRGFEGVHLITDMEREREYDIP